MSAGKASAGFSFSQSGPSISMQRSGNFSGVSGQDLMRHSMTIPAFNKEIRNWGNRVSFNLRGKIEQLSSKGKDKTRTYHSGIHKGKTEKSLKRSIRPFFRKEDGGEQIDTIGFNLERHGVFFYKGVGNGYIMRGGSVNRVAESDLSGVFRKKNDWYNSTLDKHTTALSDIIARHAGNAIVLNTKRMYIQ